MDGAAGLLRDKTRKPGRTPLPPAIVRGRVAFLPMTLANFAVAVAVPKLTRRLGNAHLLAGGLALTLIGMARLSRLSAGTPTSAASRCRWS